ncbi:MAG: DUF2249 domain-containing protein [Thermoactinomyces sp.]
MVQNKQHSIELDVRDDLRKRMDPFKKIMDAIKNVKDEDQFILHTTFKPAPLIRVLKLKGFDCEAEKMEKDHWVCTFYKKQKQKGSVQKETSGKDERQPAIYRLDNRGLIPPEPMVRTLNQLEKAQPGDQVIIWNDRVPVYLLEELESLGYTYEIDQKDDGSAEVTITKTLSDGK